MTDDTNSSIVPLKPVDLDKLDASQIRNSSCEFDPATWGTRAQAMLVHVDALKCERAQKSILLGLFLYRVKWELGHGQFGEWIEEYFRNPSAKGAPRASVRTANNVMALAAKFCRSKKLLLPEIIASQQLALGLQSEEPTDLREKLEAFVGSNSLTELYFKHGIRKQGGNQRTALPIPVDGEAPTSPAAELNEEQIEAQMFASAMDTITKAEQHLLAELTWSMLAPESAELLENKLKSVLASFHERLLRARHERAS